MLPVPGTLVFAHTTGIMGRIIRLGERIRWRSGAFYNHVAIVDRIEGDKVFIIQAEARGVTNTATLNEVAPGGKYLLVNLPIGIDPSQVIEFARQQVGSQYGWWSIISVAIDIITPSWFPSVRRPGTWICSALSGESLRCGGWIHDWPDIYLVTPTQLYLAVSGLK